MTVNGEAKPQHTKRAARGWRKRPLASIRVGKRGLEPPTPTMSTWCSNQLSYLPDVPPSIQESGSPSKIRVIRICPRGR